MRLNQHPDFCRTIKYHDRIRYKKMERDRQVYPSKKFIDANTKIIRVAKKVFRIFTHSFNYHATKGWRLVARDWKGGI